MSTIRANSILDASGGSTATINGMTPTAQSLQGFRNRIINGDMRIDQRNNGASVPGPGLTYTVDRWAVLTATGSGNAFQRISDAPTGFDNSLRITIGTGAAPTSGQQNIVFQAIEGFNVADFGLGAAGATTFTASFWVKSSIAGTYSAWFQNSGSTRSYIATFTINSANTWEFETLTIPGDTTGTWLKTNGAGLLFGISLGVGSTFQTTAGAWAAGDFKGTAGSVNLVATSGATFQITGVQLEAGSVATPFEQIDYGRELMLCQRYFWNNVSNQSGAYQDASTVVLYVLNPVPMRAAPTVTAASLTLDVVNLGAPTMTPIIANTDVTGYRISGFPNASSSTGVHVGIANNSNKLNASAEL
jgi:hypothetical protein